MSLGNQIAGIAIDGASSNTVGGLTPDARNLVSGNVGDGIVLRTTGATGNVIRGNYIGTDLSGSAALGNTDDGVSVEGVAGNTIGGATAAERNVISGNEGDGVALFTIDATGNSIIGNFIGLDAAGTDAVGNGDDGVVIQDAPGNTVGGSSPGARKRHLRKRGGRRVHPVRGSNRQSDSRQSDRHRCKRTGRRGERFGRRRHPGRLVQPDRRHGRRGGQRHLGQ